jgi:hypothetical protein
MVSQVLLRVDSSTSILIYVTPRCTAKPENLDGEAGLRSHEHTAALADEFSLKMLWEDYGVVGDMIVSLP